MAVKNNPTSVKESMKVSVKYQVPFVKAPFKVIQWRTVISDCQGTQADTESW